MLNHIEKNITILVRRLKVSLHLYNVDFELLEFLMIIPIKFMWINSAYFQKINNHQIMQKLYQNFQPCWVMLRKLTLKPNKWQHFELNDAWKHDASGSIKDKFYFYPDFYVPKNEKIKK
jgi:hypothetical protein